MQSFIKLVEDDYWLMAATQLIEKQKQQQKKKRLKQRQIDKLEQLLIFRITNCLNFYCQAHGNESLY